MSARELGQGVYLTPDRKVSSRYAGLFGGIVHTKVDTQKVAVVNNNQISDISSTLAKNLSSDRLSEPATMELVLKELFQRNGYNAAYTKEALGSGLFAQNKLVDALAGGKQSQLVVFNPKDITILEKSLKDRFVNQKLQIETVLRAPIRYIEGIKSQIKG